MLDFIDQKPILHPSLYIKKKTLPPKMIVSWQSGFEKVLGDFDAKKIISRNGYSLWLLGEISFAIIPIGAPYVAQFMEEMKESGVEEFLFIGSCGSLVDLGSIIVVPDKALRDEGTSYHYIPSKDEFISVEGCDELCKKLDALGVSYVKGSVWTTDAVFRETEKAASFAREKLCICVDMECSAIMAVASYAKIKVCQLFFTADRLDSTWNEGRIFNMKKGAYYNYLSLAISLIS
ncbi:MAG: nucleoside phosphorylase [Sphaerochaetaceae bacterium]|nr:nucleoside phosphorylase [Sphaerochaetaceae bacterium]